MIEPAAIATARDRWDVVGAEVALRRHGGELTGLCPFHKEKTPSFTVVPHKGFFHCFGCGAHGTPIDFVMWRRGVSFVDAVTILAGLPPQRQLPPGHAHKNHREPPPDPVKVIQLILAGATPVTTDTAAYFYLWSRGLITAWHPLKATGLLAHPELYCYEVGKKLPALIAEITSVTGVVTALQRIWVSPRLEYENGTGPQDARADLKVRKKTIGPMGNGAVRLAPVDGILGLAEGVETALAATQLYRVPVWATCGAARLGAIAIPKSVELVIIFGDNGDAGVAAAEAAREEYRRQRIECDTIFPALKYKDFNDELLAR